MWYAKLVGSDAAKEWFLSEAFSVTGFLKRGQEGPWKSCMLVLTRKVGDVIAIGDNIKIVVMAIKGKQVRLGVQADRNTVVHREEVYQKIQQEIRAAMTSDIDSTKTAGDLLRTASSTPPLPQSGSPTPRGNSKKGNAMKLVRASDLGDDLYDEGDATAQPK
jgi:carbon storage regulator